MFLRSNTERSAQQSEKSTQQNEVPAVVSVNWCFFDPQRPTFKPLAIKIPQQLFSGASQDCLGLFSNELQKMLKISVEDQNITFWHPKLDLSLDAAKKEWPRFVDHECFEDCLKEIYWVQSFSEELESLDKKFLHLIVTADTIQEQREEPDTLSSLAPGALYHSRKQDFSKKSVSPSEGAKPSVFFKMQDDESDPRTYYCNRPASMEHTLALPLLDPVFGEFLDDCKNVAFTSEDMDFALELKMEMSPYFDNEGKRRARLNETLNKYGINIEIFTIPRGKKRPYETNGFVSHKNRPILISEVKNEMCGSGSEPNIQALLYYREVLDAKSLWEDISSCHPCFTIIVVGPLIGFGGCALTDHVTSGCFSYLPLAFHTSDNDAFENLARHLVALKRAMNRLRDRYNKSDAASLPSQAVSRIFPYKRSFDSLVLDGAPSTTFSYKEGRKDGRLLFNGEMEDGVPICIKFVRKYGRQAHKFCAEKGFAPKLYGLDELPGGWLMVVMDYLDNQWIRLPDLEEPLSGEQKAELKRNIRDFLRLLHNQDMVHGDLRDINVMVNKGDPSQFRLVDFDWADKVGEARYPKFVNLDPELGRPDDVKAFEKITIEHDIHMLESL